jgi:hypothetical protein
MNKYFLGYSIALTLVFFVFAIMYLWYPRKEGFTPQEMDPLNSLSASANSKAITRDGATFIPSMGTIPKVANGDLIQHETIALPDNFNKWAQYFSVCRNQKNCGSCWAFATTEVLEYRISCMTNGKWKKYALDHGDKTGGWLAVQYIISCVRDENEKGCEGAGILQEVLRHLTEKHRNGNGLYLNGVYPYKEDNNGENSEGAVCKHFADEPRFNFINNYAVSNGAATKDEKGLQENIERIKREIYKNGPVMTSMYVFESFMDISPDNNSPSRPYSTDEMGKGKLVGGHAVIIVGWGTIPGKDPMNYKNQYWILRNSWGPQWGGKGRDGYWYWCMGDDLKGFQDGDNIMIEYGCVAGQPDLDHPYIRKIMGGSGPFGNSTKETNIWLTLAIVIGFLITIGGLSYAMYLKIKK